MDTKESLNTLQVEYEKKQREIEQLKADMCRAVDSRINAVLAKYGIFENHYHYDDLRQTAFVILLECLSTYDPSRNDNFEAFFLTHFSYEIKDLLSHKEPTSPYEECYEDPTKDVFGEAFSREVEELLMQKASVEQRFLYNVFLKNDIANPLEIAAILKAMISDVACLNGVPYRLDLSNPDTIGKMIENLAWRAKQIREDISKEELLWEENEDA